MTVSAEPDIAKLAGAMADERRARMLLALNDGRALPAMRLAAEAGVAPSTASGHLRKLVEAGLVAVEPEGRFRCYRLAHAGVGALIETMSVLAPPRAVRSLREGTRADALRRARTCYDHLAGRLGVAVFAAMVESDDVVASDGVGADPAYRLTQRGAGGSDSSRSSCRPRTRTARRPSATASTGRSSDTICPASSAAPSRAACSRSAGSSGSASRAP